MEEEVKEQPEATETATDATQPVPPEEKPTEIPIEKGKATPEQIAEIKAGKYYSVAQIARELSYGHSWILELVRTGRIKAIKPLGGQWRVPSSEYERIKREGIPPLPRAEVEKPAVTEIEVPETVVEKKVKEPEEKKKEPPVGFPFSLFMGGKK